jgi:polar amino acid transport system substrate-binding protein
MVMKRLLALLLSLLLPPGTARAQGLTIYTELAPPYQVQEPGGSLTGFAVELVQELQRRVGSREPIQVVPWVRGYNEALVRPDVLLFGMERSAERDPLFQWVGPIAEDTYFFYVRADSEAVPRTLDEARRLPRIGVYKEDIRDQALTRLGFSNLDRSLNQEVLLKKFRDGRIDAFVETPEDLTDLAREAGLDPHLFRRACEFQKGQTYLAFSRATPEALVRDWGKALEAMRKEGLFETLFRKYFPGEPLPGPPLKPF